CSQTCSWRGGARGGRRTATTGGVPDGVQVQHDEAATQGARSSRLPRAGLRLRVRAPILPVLPAALRAGGDAPTLCSAGIPAQLVRVRREALGGADAPYSSAKIRRSRAGTCTSKRSA